MSQHRLSRLLVSVLCIAGLLAGSISAAAMPPAQDADPLALHRAPTDHPTTVRSVEDIGLTTMVDTVTVAFPSGFVGTITITNGQTVGTLRIIAFYLSTPFIDIEVAAEAVIVDALDTGAVAFNVNVPLPATDLITLVLEGGSAGNSFRITSAPPDAATTIVAGAGNDVVTVLSVPVDASLTISGQGGTDDINLGDIAGDVQSILGPTSIVNDSATIHLAVENSSDSGARTVTIGTSQITGLAPATISFGSNVGELRVIGGSGGNTFTVAGTTASAGLELLTGSGADSVTVLATGESTTLTGGVHASLAVGDVRINGQAGNDVVTLGDAGGMQSILAKVILSNDGGQTAVTLDDSTDTTGRSVTIGAGLIQGLAPADIQIGAGVSAVTVKAGNGSDAFNVAPAANTAISLDGGDPTPPPPGDALTINLAGITDPGLDGACDATGCAGAWTFGNAEDIDFEHMEKVEPTADLSITKLASPDPVGLEQVLTYTLSVHNAGARDTVDATISDTLSAPAVFHSLMTPAGWSCTTPAVDSGGLVRCNIAALPAGATHVFTLTARILTMPAGEIMTNTAAVSATTADLERLNNSGSIAVGVTRKPVSISVVGSPNPSVYPDPVTFEATVAPLAPGTGTPTGNVQFQIAGVDFGSPVALVAGVAASDAISTLSPGTYTVTARYLGDSDFAAGDSPVLTQRVAPRLGLRILTDRDTMPAGWIVRYTLRVTNYSPTASTVVVTDTLPAGVVFVSADPAGYTRKGRQVIWKLTNMPAGASRDLHVSIRTYTTMRGLIVNLASATSGGFIASARKLVSIVSP